MFDVVLTGRKDTVKAVQRLIRGVLFMIATAYFFWFGDGLLFFQENKSLFIFSKEYFQKFLSKPGGLLVYAGNFLTQGYYHNGCGSVIISLFPVMLFGGLLKIYKSLSKNDSVPFLPSLFPACLLLLLQTYYEHSIYYSLGFLLIILWFYISISLRNSRQRIFVPVLFPVFYYFTGAFSFVCVGVYLTYYFIYETKLRRSLMPVLLIIFAFVTFIVFKEVILLQPSETLLKYPIPIINLSFFSIAFCVLCGYLILFPLIVEVADIYNINGNQMTISFPFVFLITIALLIALYDGNRAGIMYVEKMFFEQKWDNIIHYQEENASPCLVVQYYYNLALSEKEMLCDRLFFSRQDFKEKSLFLTHNQEDINRSVYFYYCIGLSKEAYHLAYESMVLDGYMPENTKMLIKTELINGNFKMAERHINVLKKTLNYRKWAMEYEKMLCNPQLIYSDPELGEKIKLAPQNDFFITSDDIYNIEAILLGNPGNKKAFEYKIARLLLEKNVKAVVYQVKKMKDMGYNSIPRHIEETILLFRYQNLELPYLGELTIAPETIKNFKQFQTIFALNDNSSKLCYEKINGNMKKTFWYYFQFK